jgi:hypothetical protein
MLRRQDLVAQEFEHRLLNSLQEIVGLARVVPIRISSTGAGVSGQKRFRLWHENSPRACEKAIPPK